MYGRKKIEYYIENGPEKVKPYTKSEMTKKILHSENPIKDILESPFMFSDIAIKELISRSSKNLIKYYPWKLYVEIAEARGIDISEEMKNLPEYNIFSFVDENEFTPD